MKDFLGTAGSDPQCCTALGISASVFAASLPHGTKLSPVRGVCSPVSTCGTDFQLAATPFIIHHTLEVCTHVSILLNG